MSEAHMWSRLRDNVFRGNGFHVERVENRASLGTPDVSWAGGGAEGWLELKWLSHWPNSDVVRVDHFTPQQRLWLTKRNMVGGRAHLLLGVGSDDFLLFRGVVAAQVLGKLGRQALTSAAQAAILGGLQPERLLKELLK